MSAQDDAATSGTETAGENPPRVEIDVILDFSCPWSYIGKKRLDATLEILGEGFKVNWYPYLLAADIPPGGIPRKEWLAKTYGTKEQQAKALEPIKVAGLQEGIEFNFDAMEVMPNTLDAHRVMRWAREAGKGGEMADLLFRLFFVEGEDIGDVDVLARACAKVGILDVFKAQKMLESDLDTKEVWDEILEVRKLGVKRIPAFIIARKYAVIGAEDPITLAKTLQAVQAELELDREEAARGSGAGASDN